jgi:ABC-type enterobactin transport system permease subunit
VITGASSQVAQAAVSAPASTGAASAIPYRSSAPISTASVVTAFAITALTLAALIACIAYARRRGWLMGMNVGKRVAHESGIEVRASRRLSMASSVHVVAYQGYEYLIVESGRGSVATVSPLGNRQAESSSVP